MKSSDFGSTSRHASIESRGHNNFNQAVTAHALKRQNVKKLDDIDFDLEYEDDEKLDVTPFNMEFSFEQDEIDNLRVAFNLLSDEDGTISYFEVFKKIETHHKKDEEETLVVSILKRIGDFEEIWGDRRVDFEEFFTLMKRAMAMR